MFRCCCFLFQCIAVVGLLCFTQIPAAEASKRKVFLTAQQVTPLPAEKNAACASVAGKIAVAWKLKAGRYQTLAQHIADLKVRSSQVSLKNQVSILNKIKLLKKNSKKWLRRCRALLSNTIPTTPPDKGSPNSESPQGRILLPQGDVSILAGTAVEFDGEASDPQGDPVTLNWDFQGAAPSYQGSHPGLILFEFPGRYRVTLDVTDAQGAIDPDPAGVLVEVLPKPAAADLPPSCISFSADAITPWSAALHWSGSDDLTPAVELRYQLSLDGMTYHSYSGAASFSETINRSDYGDSGSDLAPGQTYSFQLTVIDSAGQETSCPELKVELQRELAEVIYVNDSGDTSDLCRSAALGQVGSEHCHRNKLLRPNYDGKSLLQIWGDFGFSKIILMNYPRVYLKSGVPLDEAHYQEHLEFARTYFDDLEAAAAPYGMRVAGGFYSSYLIWMVYGPAEHFNCGSAQNFVPCDSEHHPYLPIGFLPGSYPNPNPEVSTEPLVVTEEQANQLWSTWLYLMRLAGDSTAAREITSENEYSYWLTASNLFWSESNLAAFRARLEALHAALRDYNVRVIMYHPIPHNTHPVDRIMRGLFSNFAQTPAYSLTHFAAAEPYYIVDDGGFPGTEPWEYAAREFEELGIPAGHLSQGFISSHVGHSPDSFYAYGYEPSDLRRWWLANKHYARGWLFYGTGAHNFDDLARKFAAEPAWQLNESHGDTTPPSAPSQAPGVSNIHASGMTLSWEPASDDSEAQCGYSESLLVYYLYYCRQGDQGCSASNMQSIDWIEQNTSFKNMQTTSTVKLYTFGRDLREIDIVKVYPFSDFWPNQTFHFALIVKDPSNNKSIYPLLTASTNNRDITSPAPTYCGNLHINASLDSNLVDLSWVMAADDATYTHNLIYRLYSCEISLANPNCNAGYAAVLSNLDTLLIQGKAQLLGAYTNLPEQCQLPSSGSHPQVPIAPGSSMLFALVVSDQAGNRTGYTPLAVNN
jgi:hypothetical protein